MTPSIHPEVPDSQFVPGRGLGMMGRRKVSGTARSGICVLKGVASARMLPANLDHVSVQWKKQGSYETAWVTRGHDCLCPYQYGHGAAVSIGLWGRVAPLLSPWCARGNVSTEVNLNQYAGTGSCIRWRSVYESLFGPPNQPKLKVSMSSGQSVEFKVRRFAADDVPSPTRLDHGDLSVMGGLAQSHGVWAAGSSG